MDQDWNSVVLKKNPNAKPKTAHGLAEAKATGAVEVQKKFDAGTNKTAHVPKNAAKIDAETEDFHHAHVTLEFKLALQKARLAKKWSQADLAKQLAVKQSVINDYESGKAIPDGSLISKMNRVLGVVLPKIPKPAKKAEDAAD